MNARNVRFNVKRTAPRKYNVGDIVYVAVKRIKGKNKPLYKKEIVVKGGLVTIRTISGRLCLWLSFVVVKIIVPLEGRLNGKI